jgi:hypothetical protein
MRLFFVVTIASTSEDKLKVDDVVERVLSYDCGGGSKLDSAIGEA